MDHIPMIEQPIDMKIDLYPHQLASIYQMEKLEREKCVEDPIDSETVETRIGINADITGYGKTLAMIALVFRDKMQWDIEHEYIVEKTTDYSNQHIRKITRQFYNRISTTLVLAGQSIIHQWVKEFAYTSLKVLAITTRKLARETDPTDYDVIIITPTMYNILIEKYPQTAWKRFIYDEPTQVRISGMRSIVSGFIWLVTATPYNISYCHRRCYSSFMRNLVGDRQFEYIQDYIIVKNDEEFIKQSFHMPVTHHHYHDCFSPIYNVVNGLTSKKVRQMIEAGNISGAIQQLGGKETDNIMDLVKKTKLLELREIEFHLKSWQLRGVQARIDEWQIRKEKIEQQLAELESRVKTMLESDCVICHDKLTDPIMEPSCQNVFCGKCILTWLRNKGACPMCRHTIKKSDLTHIVEKTSPNFAEKKIEQLPTKNEKIIEIIKGKKDGYFIIFSDWDETFRDIREVLTENSIVFSEIKGSHNTREKILKKYNDKKIQVLFLNSRYNGAGINLQGTTDIILYHKMSSGIETQVIGRANRIGRETSLEVHHLLYLKNSKGE